MSYVTVQNKLFKKDFFIIFVLTTIAFLFRLFLLKFINVVSTDGCEYLVAGKNLVSGLGYISISGTPDITYPPLYPILAGSLNLLLDNLELSGRLVSVVAGSLLIPFIYLSALFFFKDKRVSYISASFALFYPRLLDMSVEALSDSVYIFLVLSGILITWVALRKNKSYIYFLSGLIFGMAYLARAVGFLYVVMAVVSILIFRLKKENSRGIFFKILIFTLGYSLVAYSYLSYLNRHTGIWSLSPDAGFWQGAHIENYEEYIYALKEKAAYMGFFDYFLKHPATFFPRVIKNIYEMYITYLPVVIPPIFLIFIGLGLFSKTWSKEQKLVNIYLILMTFPVGIYIIYGVVERYLIPLVPIGLIWAALGTQHYCEWINNSFTQFLEKVKLKNREGIIQNTLVILLLATLIIPALKPLYIKEDEPLEHKALGLWIKNNLGSNFTIMSRKPWVSFYSDSLWHAYPYIDYKKIMDFAKDKKVDFFVIDSRTIPKTRPQLVFLLDESNVPQEDLELIYKDSSGGHLMLLYKLKY